jgi:CubicO group peptidase (beta-lactamase class C family)
MFTSSCWGILLHEKPGLIPDQLDQKVFREKYLPEALPLSDPRKADIKLGHLLAMTSGMAESTRNPGIVQGNDVKLEATKSEPRSLDQDQSALQTPMWTDPGGGYFYSSQGVHVASIVLRHLIGMEMQSYIDGKLAKPMQFGGWGYDMTRADGTKLQHTPGGGGIALRATDILRFGYLLLRNGRWEDHSLIPAEHIQLCSRPSPYNPHSPFSLQFEVNKDGHVAGAPRDTFFKSGAGGFCLYVVPSLDLVIYKMSCVGLPELDRYDLGFGAKANNADSSRDSWKPHPFDQFHDGPVDGDTGTRRTLEMVLASVL